MKRRNFIKSTAAVSAGAAFAPYILKGIPQKKVPMESLDFINSDTIFIYIELLGGNDGLNTVIPLADEARYMELRPTVHITRDDAVRFSDSDVYFHPSIVENIHRDGILGLLDRGNLAVVEGVGYDNPSLSHFSSQKIWLSGINSKDPRDPRLQEGWLGRYLLSKLPDYPTIIPDHPLAIALGGNTPLLFKSAMGHMGISLTDPEEFYEKGKGLSPVDPALTGTDTYDNEYNFIHTMARQSQQYSEEVFNAYEAGKDKLQVPYSDGLAQKFKLISTLIAGGLKTKVYFINQSFYDSHAQQFEDDPRKGQHPTLLSDIATGISEFMDDAIKQGFADRVVGMTTSEFGRRAHDNGSRGTDHGTSSNLFMFGSDKYVNAGAHGQPPNLNDLENGNLRHEFDFRRTFANVLNAWFGAEQEEINQLFGEPIDPMSVINPWVTSVEDKLAGTTSGKLSIHPNPSMGTANLTFELKAPANVDIYIFRNDGRLEQKVRSGRLEAGVHNYPLNVAKSGSYNCAVIVNGRRNLAKFSVIR